MVDNDHKQFAIWKSQQSQESSLTPMGPPACGSQVPTPTPPPPAPPQASPAADPASHDSTPSASKGAIAGGTIGGLAAVALCLSAYLVLRRRRIRRTEREKLRQEEEARTEPNKSNMYREHAAYWKAEMPSDKQPPQEMPLEHNTGYTLEPYEVHGEATHELPGTPRVRS